MKRLEQGVYFITGSYGVGKTTMCQQLSKAFGLPYFSASELISLKNNEVYGANKAVKNKEENQHILSREIEQKLLKYPTFFLNGHTTIFKKDHTVDLLPTEPFKHFHLAAMILLEAPPFSVLEHLNKRDQILYSKEEIFSLIEAERERAQSISEKLQIPFIRHLMKYDDTDCSLLVELLQRVEL